MVCELKSVFINVLIKLFFEIRLECAAVKSADNKIMHR